MKPYIICYMMTSIDGRIDCAMTEKLRGVSDYYHILDELNLPSTVSGRITAQMELALEGEFIPKRLEHVENSLFSKKVDASGYDIIFDTNGKLLWNDDCSYEKPHIIVCSQKVTKEYLEYLDSKNISYIVAGEKEIDLTKVCSILYDHFNVRRLGIVGGAQINTSFLKAHLLDEIVLLIGAGIDARKNYPTMFDGLEDDSPLLQMKLKEVRRLESDAVLISYKPYNL